MNRLVGTAFAVVLASTTPSAAQDDGQRYAVLVGVNEYDHAKLSPLKYAENDATAMRDVLKAGGYDTTLLTAALGKTDAKSAPTKDNVEKAIKDVLDKAKRRDTVVVSLAGHGLQFDKGKGAYFCPRDAAPSADKAETMVSMAKLFKQMDASGAGVKLLLVDACRNDPTSTRGIDGATSPRARRGWRRCSVARPASGPTNSTPTSTGPSSTTSSKSSRASIRRPCRTTGT